MKIDVDYNEAIELVYLRLDEFVSTGYDITALREAFKILNMIHFELKKEEADEKD